MSIGDLSSKLKNKIRQDRERFEQIAESEFKTLQHNLSVSSKNALSTIEADINASLGRMSKTISNSLSQLEEQNHRFQKTMLSRLSKFAMLGLSLILGVALGTWLLTVMTNKYISTLYDDITALRRQKKQAQQTLKALEQQTWGIQFLESERGRFIVLPQEMKIKTGWSLGESQAIKVE